MRKQNIFEICKKKCYHLKEGLKEYPDQWVDFLGLKPTSFVKINGVLLKWQFSEFDLLQPLHKWNSHHFSLLKIRRLLVCTKNSFLLSAVFLSVSTVNLKIRSSHTCKIRILPKNLTKSLWNKIFFCKLERNFQHWLATNKTLGNGFLLPNHILWTKPLDLYLWWHVV